MVEGGYVHPGDVDHAAPAQRRQDIDPEIRRIALYRSRFLVGLRVLGEIFLGQLGKRARRLLCVPGAGWVLATGNLADQGPRPCTRRLYGERRAVSADREP